MAGGTLRPILLRNNVQVLGGGPIKGPNVVTMCLHDDGFVSMSGDVNALLKESWQAVRAYALKRFDKQRAIFQFGLAWSPADFAAKVLSRDEFEKSIRQMSGWRKDAESTSATGVRGVLHVDSRALRDSLVQVTHTVLDDMKSALARRAALATLELLDEARGHIKWLDERPDDLDRFAAYKKRFAESKGVLKAFDGKVDELVGKQEKGMEGIKEKLSGNIGMYGILKAHDYKLPIQDKVALDNLEEERARLSASVAEAQHFLSSVQQQMNAMLMQDIGHLQEDLLDTMAALAAGPLLSVSSDVEAMLELLDNHGQKIDSFEGDARRFAKYQQLFKMPQDDFGNLEVVKKDYQKHKELWTSLDHWQRLTHGWLTCKSGELDLEDLQAKADEFARSSYKMSKMYKVSPPRAAGAWRSPLTARDSARATRSARSS